MLTLELVILMTGITATLEVQILSVSTKRIRNIRFILLDLLAALIQRMK